MKILLSVLFVVLISIQSSSQINPDEFPKIGFADMWWLKVQKNNSQIDYSDSLWFYPALSELGLTHVVTNGSALGSGVPYNSNYNSSIKILDADFNRRTNQTFFYPHRYALGTGNTIFHFAYEAGGEIAILTNKDDNYGFGTPDKSSWWIHDYNNECIGDKNYPDPENEGTIVHFAQVGVHSPGILLKAKPDQTHLPFNSRGGNQINYWLRIRARIDGASGSVNVAKVRIWEVLPGDTPPPIGDHYKTFNNLDEEQEPEVLTDYTYYITADAFGGNDYIELESPQSFKKTAGLENSPTSDLWITIEWLGVRNLYIDKIAVYNTFYKELFITDPTNAITNIKNGLNGLFGSVETNPLFCNIYYDEPAPWHYRALGEVSNIAENVNVLGEGKYINGATAGYSNDMTLIANSQRRLPYVLYDFYPITENTSTSSSGSNSIQNAYNNLIYNYWGSPGHGVQRYNGLKAGIEWAQNFTPEDPTDDVPFYHTIQVQAEKNVSNGQWVEPYRYRAPTNNEILAQGNLALCYGAKGLMYFLVCTLTPNSADSDVAFYGLFEQDGVPFGTIIQNPAAPQKRNDRYWGVKHLHNEIAPIENELLSLTWQNAFYINNGAQPSGTYITYVQSIGDNAASTHVQLGLFKKTSELTNQNLEHFFVLNRRTLATEQRTIKVTINKSTSIFTNWKIVEVGTSNSWVVNKTGYFQTVYQPGEGKLFRLEPVMIAGGALAYNETIPAGISFSIKGTVMVPSGKSLTIGAGCNISFNSGCGLNLSGMLNAVGTDANRIIFSSAGSSLPGSWGYLSLDGSGSSGSLLNYVTVQYASGVKFINGANVTLQNSNIKNCNYGVYVYNSNANIRNNWILNNSTHGIQCDGAGFTHQIHDNKIKKGGSVIYVGIYITGASTAYISHNQISKFSYGMYIGGSASAYFLKEYSPYITANNLVDSCNYAITSAWGGRIDNMIYYSMWYSSIHNNFYYDLYSYRNSLITSVYDYYGGGQPSTYCDGTSTITVSNSLTSDPWNGALFKVATQVTPTNSMIDDDTEGFEFEHNNDYTGAIEYYKNLLKNGTVSEYIYSRLAHFGAEAGRKDITSYFEKLMEEKNQYQPFIMQLLAGLYMRQGEGKKSQGIYDDLITEFPNTQYEKPSWLEKFYYSLNVENDTAKAEQLLSILKSKYSNDDEEGSIETAQLMLNPTEGLNKTLIQNKESNDENTNNISVKYELLGNYPNPFNPATTISYTLPYQSFVELIIYDIMGREIKSFNIFSQSSGYQNIVWDGTNEAGSAVASGIYLYRIKAKSLEGNNEEFEKSAKLILLK